MNGSTKNPPLGAMGESSESGSLNDRDDVHNDCGRTVSGGVRPKVRPSLVQNIPNGVSVCDGKSDNDSSRRSQNHRSISQKLHNGKLTNGDDDHMNERCNGLDSYVRKNVDFGVYHDKCPPKDGMPFCSPLSASNGILPVNNHESENGDADDGDIDEDDDIIDVSISTSSSDAGNEGDDCLTDDCCIYTYKGDQGNNGNGILGVSSGGVAASADLPSSFFKLDIRNSDGGATGSSGAAGLGSLDGNRNGNLSYVDDRATNGGFSSPEMDFLEMDFDPGPSCDQDSDSDRELSPQARDDGNEQESNGVCSSYSRGLCNSCVSCNNSKATCKCEVSGGASESAIQPSELNGTAKPDFDNPLSFSSESAQTSNDNAGDVSGEDNTSSGVNSREDTDQRWAENNSMYGFCQRTSRASNSRVCGGSSDYGMYYRLENDLGRNEGGAVGESSACFINLGSSSAPELSPERGEVSGRSLPHSASVQGRLSLPTRDMWGQHWVSGGDLCPPGEDQPPGDKCYTWRGACYSLQPTENNSDSSKSCNLQSVLYHTIMAKQLILAKQTEAEDDPVERRMIWSEKEACAKQITQIGTSACGATAVINVMLALNIPYSMEAIKEGVRTKLRAEEAPIPEYLMSRAFAGANHEDLIRGVDHASGGRLAARFFHMYPTRDFSLSRWLAYWIHKGAVPIATLNLQRGGFSGQIPDAWHHQMVFGVGPRGIYLTNPLDVVSEKELMPQLSSPSVLLVRRADIVKRWGSHCDLRPLATHPDQRWRKMNALGQVVNIIREAAAPRVAGCRRNYTQHVAIPASYSSGITLVVPRDTEAYRELISSPELPISNTQET